MKTIFRTAFYLRSNYVNKDGKVPVMLRIYLNNERLSLGSTGIAILRSQWDGKKERVKGRSTEVLSINLELDNIQNGLLNIFRRMEFNESLSLERIKMEFLGKKEDIGTIMELFDRHITDVKKQVGVSVSSATLQKYNVCKKHFTAFLKSKYSRTDLKLSELTYIVLHDFDLYLRTTVGQAPNTATKTLKTFKTITLFGGKLGVLHHDPFVNLRFHMEPVDRGFLTDEEILRVANKDLGIPRLEMVRDLFVFACFTGLAYIDVANLTPDHIVTAVDHDQATENERGDQCAAPRHPESNHREVQPQDVSGRQALSRPDESEDQFVPQGDRRPLRDQEEADLPSCPPHLCHHVAKQRRPHRIRFQDVGAYEHPHDADLRPHHEQEDRTRHGATVREAR